MYLDITGSILLPPDYFRITSGQVAEQQADVVDVFKCY